MKIPREYSLLFVIGLFASAYLLDAVVQPLDLTLPSPYHYLQSAYMSVYPFTSFSILIKALGVFLAPLWLLSFFSDRGFGKVSVLFIVSIAMQLYAYQDVATHAELIPLEWALSISVAGLALLLPVVYLFIKSMLLSAHANLTSVRMQEKIEEAQVRAKQDNVTDHDPLEMFKKD